MSDTDKASDSEQNSTELVAQPTAAAKKKSDKNASAAPKKAKLSEEEINAPTKQTLIMLGVISISTLLMWAAGRAACNYHVPGESLTPRKVSVEERTRSAKDVGLEFAQAIYGAKFDVAEQLATGEALNFVRSQKASCGACEQRVAARKQLNSVAFVLKANSVDSIVQVRTVGTEQGEVVSFWGIEREARKWRVTRILKSAEGAELKAAPPSPNGPSFRLSHDGAAAQDGAENSDANEASASHEASDEIEAQGSADE